RRSSRYFRCSSHSSFEASAFHAATLARNWSSLSARYSCSNWLIRATVGLSDLTRRWFLEPRIFLRTQVTGFMDGKLGMRLLAGLAWWPELPRDRVADSRARSFFGGGHFDLHLCPARKPRDGDRRARRKGFREVARINSIHGGEIVHRRQENRRFHHIGE